MDFWVLLTTTLLLFYTRVSPSLCVPVSCPKPYEMYVQRTKYLFCRKVYNCLPGYEILPCSENCQKEKCVKCQTGKVQPDLIHSDSADEQRRCFTPKPDMCDGITVQDKPEGVAMITCSRDKFCKCALQECFYGSDACSCSRKWDKCGVNYTLIETGECVPCGKDSYKTSVGCQSCFKLDPYSDQVVDPTTPVHTTTVVTVTDKPTEKTTKSNKSTTKYVKESSSTSTSSILPGSTDGVVSEEGEPEMKYAVIVIPVVILVVIIVVIVIVIIVLCKTGRCGRFKERLRIYGARRNEGARYVVHNNGNVEFNRPEECEEPNGPPTPEIITANTPPPAVMHSGRQETIPVQEENPPDSPGCEIEPLLSPSSPGVNTQEPSLHLIQKQMEAKEGGKISLESCNSGTSSGSIQTPVPETGPSPVAHPLENVSEYIRSISREKNPIELPVDIEVETTNCNAANTGNPHHIGSTDINVSSHTTVFPLSINSSSSPSAVVSDSIQTVGTDDHRVSAITPDTNMLLPKIPEQSMCTASLSSDCADNTHNLDLLQPDDAVEEDYRYQSSHHSGKVSNKDSMCELKKKNKTTEDDNS